MSTQQALAGVYTTGTGWCLNNRHSQVSTQQALAGVSQQALAGVFTIVVVVVVVVVVGQTVGSIASKTLAYDCLCTLELCTASMIATS